MRYSLSALRTVVAFPGANSVEPVVKAEMELDQAATGNDLRFLPYTLPPASPSRIPWVGPDQHLPGDLRHGAGAGGERLRGHRFRSCSAAGPISWGRCWRRCSRTTVNSPCRSIPWESSTVC